MINISQSPTLQKIHAYKLSLLKGLYDQCNPDQQDLFNRMYKSVDEIAPEKIDWAIVQCENTLVKNIRK